MAIRRLCFCGKIAQEGRHKCKAHQQEYDARRREQEKARGRRRLRGKAWMAIREKVLTRFGHQCAAFVEEERCKKTERLEVHHMDFDRTNNSPANLLPVCFGHHRALERGEDVEFLLPPPPGLPPLPL
jgi:hypothetical protein